MINNNIKITSDKWIKLTQAYAEACDGPHNKLTVQQLNNIIANRYGDTKPECMEVNEFYDLLVFLYCLNNKTNIFAMALDIELEKKLWPDFDPFARQII